MDVFEAIEGHRSVREFLPDEVRRRDLELILDMARYAPNAGNMQPWKFLLVRDEDNKGALKEAVKKFLRQRISRMSVSEEDKIELKEGFHRAVDSIFAAPVLVFVLVDASRWPELAAYDGALAVQNIMLAAHALGYGTSFQTTIFPQELVKDHFSIPDHYKFICAVPIGKPAAHPQTPEKKDLASFICEERFRD